MRISHVLSSKSNWQHLGLGLLALFWLCSSSDGLAKEDVEAAPDAWTFQQRLLACKSSYEKAEKKLKSKTLKPSQSICAFVVSDNPNNKELSQLLADQNLGFLIAQGFEKCSAAGEVALCRAGAWAAITQKMGELVEKGDSPNLMVDQICGKISDKLCLKALQKTPEQSPVELPAELEKTAEAPDKTLEEAPEKTSENTPEAAAKKTASEPEDKTDAE